MKKILTRVSRRVLLATTYGVGTLVFVSSLLGLMFLLWLLVLPEERVIYLGYSSVFLFVIVVVTFVAGRDFERKTLLGRPIGVEGLTTPGTWLPQSEGLFRILNKHELGKGLAMGIFLKVGDIELAMGAPEKAQIRKLFCVIAQTELIPSEPRFVRLTYDQRSHLTLSVLPEQNPEIN